MNDFERTLVATLQAEAQEAAMTTDTTREAQTLAARLDAADRRRRRWTWTAVSAAAAAAVVALLVVRAVTGTAEVPPMQPTPTPTPSEFSSTAFRVPFTAMIPGWAAAITPPLRQEEERQVTWAQSDCTVAGAPGACADGADLKLRFLSPVVLYRPGDGPVASPVPGYAGYVAYLRQIGASGKAAVTDLTSTTVDGRKATVMSITPQEKMYGAIGCVGEFDAAKDCWGLAYDGDTTTTLRLAVIDDGVTPLLVWSRTNQGSSQSADAVGQFDQMLSTLTFR